MAVDWRTLPAGPELDVLVAEKILGWTWDPMSDTNGSIPGFEDHASLRDPGGRVRAQRWKKDGHLSTWCCDVPELPRFSSHIDAAWQVVDRFAHFAPVIFMCGGIMMLGESGRPAGGEWGCRFDCWEDKKENYASATARRRRRRSAALGFWSWNERSSREDSRAPRTGPRKEG